jgi:hypothetical protein
MLYVVRVKFGPWLINSSQKGNQTLWLEGALRDALSLSTLECF